MRTPSVTPTGALRGQLMAAIISLASNIGAESPSIGLARATGQRRVLLNWSSSPTATGKVAGRRRRRHRPTRCCGRRRAGLLALPLAARPTDTPHAPTARAPHTRPLGGAHDARAHCAAHTTTLRINYAERVKFGGKTAASEE